MTTSFDTIDPGRRLVSTAVALSPLIGWLPVAQAEENAAFLRISAELTGVPVAALDAETGAQLRLALGEAGYGEELQQVLSGAVPGDELAVEIIAAWYSGVHPSAYGPQVHTFNDALVWRVLDFMQAPGQCSPNDWSQPPASAA